MWSHAGADFGDSANTWNAAASKSVCRSACSTPHSARVYFQMLSKSRSAAGESRYSAMRTAELALECARVEALWLAALFTLDQRRANYFDLCAALLLTPNEIKVTQDAKLEHRNSLILVVREGLDRLTRALLG